MGTFMQRGSTPVLFPDKEAVPGQTAHGLTNEQVPRAVDFNALKNASMDLRSHSLGKEYDIREFGDGVAEGDETADTDAFLALSAEFNRDFGSGQQPGSAVIRLPQATYLIAETIEQIGGPGNGVALMAHLGTPRSSTGVVLQWTGDLGGTLAHWRGMNGSVVDGVQFDGNGRAETVFWASEYYDAANPGNYIGSSGLSFLNCTFHSPRAVATAVPFKVGFDDGVTVNLQASEYHWDNCRFAGNGLTPASAGISIATAGNAKNFSACRCIFEDVDYGFYQPNGSGVTSLDKCSFANIGYNVSGWAVYMASGNRLSLSDVRMENGTTGYRAGVLFTDNGVVADVRGGYFAGRAPTDDFVIQVNGPTTLSGFSFEVNSRVGSNVCKIKVSGPTDGGGSQEGALVVTGCGFGWNTTRIEHLPIYDGGGVNHLFESDYARGVRHNVSAFGNRAYETGTTPNGALPNELGKPVFCTFGAIGRSSLDTGITVLEEDGKYSATVPYTAFQTAALSRTLTLGVAQPNTKITAAYLITTPAFGGTAGTLQLELGDEDDSDCWILAHDVKSAAVTKGGADADMGTRLTRANSVQGGYLYSAQKNLKIKIVSSAGNLSGLTAGSVQVVFEWRFVG